MRNTLSRYVSALTDSLRIDSRVRDAIDKEIRTHLEDHRNALIRSGLTEEEANDAAINSFGDGRLIAHDLLNIHSKGKWQDAFLTALPHMVVAMLLTACFRYGAVWGAAFLLATVVGVYHLVSRRAPSWSFSWLGYCLLPFMLLALLLLDVTKWWTILGIAYIPCAIVLILYVVKLTASRDVLYVSLMLAPWVVIFAWCTATDSLVNLQTGNVNSYALQDHARDLVGSFVVLAISSVAFTRIGARWGKALALIIPMGFVFTYVTLRCWTSLSLWGWIASALALVLISAPTLREFRS
ncbi:MAG: hypothetical protein JW846_00485 [Dehalococcoidia bacterium]|nr:hypothetical protein [Dehalococcoidia bacterium]